MAQRAAAAGRQLSLRSSPAEGTDHAAAAAEGRKGVVENLYHKSIMEKTTLTVLIPKIAPTCGQPRNAARRPARA